MSATLAFPALANPAIDRARELEDAVDREGGRLYALALSVLGNPVEAQDAVQETMVQAWRDWDRIDDPRCRGAWLATICVRTCLRQRRRLRRHFTHAALTSHHPAAAPAASGFGLVEACSRLSPRQRAVVSLHYGYGYSLDECAPIIGCSPGTVRPHLRRALEKLRHEYSDD